VPSERDDETFQYNFLVRSASQYQILFKVSFTVSEEKEDKLVELSCCSCENRIPSTYCTTEKLYFCEECCSDHHQPKLMHLHEL
jgi:predicted aldo/keto reductase-like oxidoreductase